MTERNCSTEASAEGMGGVCPGCGRRFGCGAANGETHCWCMQQPQGRFVPAPGVGCYCPQCLAQRIAAVSGGA